MVRDLERWRKSQLRMLQKRREVQSDEPPSKLSTDKARPVSSSPCQFEVQTFQNFSTFLSRISLPSCSRI